MKINTYESSHLYIITGIVGILIIAGAVYASRSGGNSEARGSEPTTVSATAEQSDKRLAPNFTLNRMGGGTIELASYRGQKPVVLDFFATWCPNCRRDMPNLNAFYETYKDQVEVIGIDLQEQESLVSKFATDLGLTFPIALDTQGRVSQQYGVRYTNFHVLIDRDGNIVGSIPGDIKEQDIINLINQ